MALPLLHEEEIHEVYITLELPISEIEESTKELIKNSLKLSEQDVDQWQYKYVSFLLRISFLLRKYIFMYLREIVPYWRSISSFPLDPPLR